jgi:hypothetical protein
MIARLRHLRASFITFSTILICLGLLSSCSSEQATTSDLSPVPEVNQQALRAHIGFLADDLLAGRNTGTEGYEIAARYVAAHFAQYNMQPKGDKSSYLQKINFRQAFLDLASPSMQWRG